MDDRRLGRGVSSRPESRATRSLFRNLERRALGCGSIAFPLAAGQSHPERTDAQAVEVQGGHPRPSAGTGRDWRWNLDSRRRELEGGEGVARVPGMRRVVFEAKEITAFRGLLCFGSLCVVKKIRRSKPMNRNTKNGKKNETEFTKINYITKL